MTLSRVVASEGFVVTESDLDGPSPAEARFGEELGALDWLTEYVTDEHAKTGAGVARGRLETAYHEAHGNHGRNVARRIINSQIALSIQIRESTEFEGDRRGLLMLATGPGEVRNGIYLYPACSVLSPLATTTNGEGASTPQPSSRRHPSPPRRRL